MAEHGDAAQVPLPPGDDDFENEAHPPHVQQAPNLAAPPFIPQQQQQPYYHWPLPPFMLPPQHAAQPHPQPHKVKLPTFWSHKPRAWFTHAEAAFDTYYVTDSRQCFNLILPCLSEDALDGVSALVELPHMVQHPYLALKDRLLEIYQPDP